jgi:hypothetical protein
MGTITSVNGIGCDSIVSIDGVAKINIAFFDNNTFCPGGSPTPTPTNTPTNTPTPQPTPTPTPTPCARGCCLVELCYSDSACNESCTCSVTVPVYLGLNCSTDPCTLANAYGIFDDDRCGTYAVAGYYSDGTECWYWDGSGTLFFSQPC